MCTFVFSRMIYCCLNSHATEIVLCLVFNDDSYFEILISYSIVATFS